jgi:hypothetical protein
MYQRIFCLCLGWNQPMNGKYKPYEYVVLGIISKADNEDETGTWVARETIARLYHSGGRYMIQYLKSTLEDHYDDSYKHRPRKLIDVYRLLEKEFNVRQEVVDCKPLGSKWRRRSSAK